MEAEKEKHLSGHDNAHDTIDHAPGWNETLASVSEAYVSLLLSKSTDEQVKADKEDLSNITIEELQMKTIKVRSDCRKCRLIG